MNKTAKHLPKIIAQASLLSLTFWMGAVCGGDSRRAAPRLVPPEIPAAVPANPERAVALPLAPIPTAALPPVPAVAPAELLAAKAACQPVGQAQCSYQSCRRGLFRGRR